MGYGKWWWMRRATAIGIVLLFIATAYGWVKILEGNYSASLFLGLIPMADPLAVLQTLAATKTVYKTALIGAGLVILFYLLLGRAFCGWVCPYGLLSDFARWLSDKLQVNKPFKGFPIATRYYLLVILLVSPLLVGVTAYEYYNPISMVSRALIFGSIGAGVFGWVIVGALFVYEFAIDRTGWCRSLCPLGAFYTILGRYSLINVALSRSGESEQIDLDVCPEPGALNVIKNGSRSGGCIMCGACIDNSNDKSIGFRIGNRKKQSSSPLAQELPHN